MSAIREAVLILLLMGAAASHFVGRAQAQVPVPSPSEFLGFRLGADGLLASYDQIVSYFRALDTASNRVTVQDLGPTTRGLPYIVVLISSPENQSRLEQYREANNLLYDPRRTGDEDAKRLIADGKTIVAVQMGASGTEVGAAQVSMELAYHLATENTPRVTAILQNTIIVLSPSTNPDSTQMVSDWNRTTKATAFEGTVPPFVYPNYASHVDERDSYLFARNESQMLVSRIWNRWHPQISLDLREIASNGPRVSVPPYMDSDPNIDPILQAAGGGIGTAIASDLMAQGKEGVLAQAMHDLWMPAQAYVSYHGGVYILTEVARAQMASPVTLKFEQLGRGPGYDAKQAAWNFSRPWRGGPWRLRDVMDYGYAAVQVILDHAAKNREQWLTGFYKVNHNSVGRKHPATGMEKPFAVIIPNEQKDTAAAFAMLRALQVADVEVHRARAAFTADGKLYPSGSHVILMAQPSGPFAKTLAETHRSLDAGQYAGPPPGQRPERTAFNLPLMMGVETSLAQSPFQADLEIVSVPISAPVGMIVGGGNPVGYAIGRDNVGYMAINRLLREGVTVQAATTPFATATRSFGPGTFIVPLAGQPEALSRIATASQTIPVQIYALETIPPGIRHIQAPRVALYQSYVPTRDEAWTRGILEQWNMPFKGIQNSRIRAGSLNRDFDVVVLPDQDATVIVNGHLPGTMPDEYVGGIAEEGTRALREFVEAGGILIALNSASQLPIDRFGLPVRNALATPAGDAPPPTATGPFYGSGSILRTVVDPTHAISAGYGRESAAWFEHGPAFELLPGSGKLGAAARTIVTYPAQGPLLLSGWMAGGEKLNGKAAVVEVRLGRGAVILYGIRPQSRAQTWSTVPLFLNALYYAAEDIPKTTSAADIPRVPPSVVSASKAKQGTASQAPPQRPPQPPVVKSPIQSRPSGTPQGGGTGSLPKTPDPGATPNGPRPAPRVPAQASGSCPYLGTLAVSAGATRKGQGVEARGQLVSGQRACFQLSVSTRGDLEAAIEVGYRVEGEGLEFRGLKETGQSGGTQKLRFSRLDVTPNTRVTVTVIREDSGSAPFVLQLYFYPN